MGKILLLDDLTINKIAAGEVIERPASVVKEMVENSIDAGAKNITVEIKNGGISLIRIKDDGCGIAEDDMEIAFERHATSKIRSADDLETVKSMGFRGEALASIAAISKVEMVSKKADSDIGHKIVVEGGKILEQNETGCPVGTTITVQNLFYNTPVRYKFLKKDYTEAGYIEDVISRIALVNIDVSLKLISNGKTVLQTNGSGNLKNTIYSIYGKDIETETVEINYQYEDIKVSGVIGNPVIARSNRSNQIFFVNGRYIKDKNLTAAAEQAYKGMIPVGRYGFLVLNLEMDPKKVDVNVHPAKLEVRFEDENSIFKAVYHAIKSGLTNSENIKPQENNKVDFSSNIKNDNFYMPKFTYDKFNYNIEKSNDRVSAKSKLDELSDTEISNSNFYEPIVSTVKNNTIDELKGTEISNYNLKSFNSDTKLNDNAEEFNGTEILNSKLRKDEKKGLSGLFKKIIKEPEYEEKENHLEEIYNERKGVSYLGESSKTLGLSSGFGNKTNNNNSANIKVDKEKYYNPNINANIVEFNSDSEKTEKTETNVLNNSIESLEINDINNNNMNNSEIHTLLNNKEKNTMLFNNFGNNEKSNLDTYSVNNNSEEILELYKSNNKENFIVNNIENKIINNAENIIKEDYKINSLDNISKEKLDTYNSNNNIEESFKLDDSDNMKIENLEVHNLENKEIENSENVFAINDNEISKKINFGNTSISSNTKELDVTVVNNLIKENTQELKPLNEKTSQQTQKVGEVENIYKKEETQVVDLSNSIKDIKEKGNTIISNNTQPIKYENIDIKENIEEMGSDLSIKNAENDFNIIAEKLIKSKLNMENTQIIDTAKVRESIREGKRQENAEFDEMYKQTFGVDTISVRKEKELEKFENDKTNIISDFSDANENLSVFEDSEEIPEIRYKLLGMAFSTYIIIEMKSEIYIVNQQLAKEKIIYEKIKEKYYNLNEKDEQFLLLPDVITLTNNQMILAKENVSVFEKIGFTYEEFGKNTIKLNSVPGICEKLNTKQLFLDILDGLDKIAITAIQEKEEKIIETIAKNVSEKMNLEEDDVDIFMNELFSLQNPFIAPNGESIAMKMTKYELERKFSRK